MHPLVRGKSRMQRWQGDQKPPLLYYSSKQTLSGNWPQNDSNQYHLL